MPSSDALRLFRNSAKVKYLKDLFWSIVRLALSGRFGFILLAAVIFVVLMAFRYCQVGLAIIVVESEACAGKGKDFAEGAEDRAVYFACRVDYKCSRKHGASEYHKDDSEPKLFCGRGVQGFHSRIFVQI